MSIYASNIYFNVTMASDFTTTGDYDVAISYWLPTTVMDTSIAGYNVSYNGSFSLKYEGNQGM